LEDLDQHEPTTAGHGRGHGAEDLAAVFVVPVVQDVLEQVDVRLGGDDAEHVPDYRVDPVGQAPCVQEGVGSGDDVRAVDEHAAQTV
jgi:hypothetical protein